MTTTPTPTPVPALDRFFAALRRSPVTRSPQGRVAGVCAGLAARLEVSTRVVRVATVALAILGPALAIYLLAWLLLPDQQGGIRLERALRGGDTSSIVLLVATVAIVLPDAGMHSRMGWLPLVLVAVVAWACYRGWQQRDRHNPTSAGPQPPSASDPDRGPQDTPPA